VFVTFRVVGSAAALPVFPVFVCHGEAVALPGAASSGSVIFLIVNFISPIPRPPAAKRLDLGLFRRSLANVPLLACYDRFKTLASTSAQPEAKVAALDCDCFLSLKDRDRSTDCIQSRLPDFPTSFIAAVSAVGVRSRQAGHRGER
jgi:hypothetical protein